MMSEASAMPARSASALDELLLEAAA